MCQLRVMVEKDGHEPEMVMENVSLVTGTPEGVEVSAMFDEPTLIPSVTIKKVDMLSAKVILAPV